MTDAALHSDPFPFSKDPWWRKVVILAAVVVPPAALAAVVATGWRRTVGPPELAAFLLMWPLTSLAVTLGYHRMLAHRAFTARAPTRYALLAVGAMTLQGPPADWAATHVRHHAMADRDGDPHSPLEGFWHAHLGWLLRDRFVRSGTVHDRLMRDDAVRFVQRTWFLWAVLGFILPGLLVAALRTDWDGFWPGVLWGGVLRVLVSQHFTWSVNSVTHTFGSRAFDTPDRSRNNLLVALLAWGEGWHNNHHAFPNSAFIGLRWWQIDAGAWFLVLLRRLGQVEAWHRPARTEQAHRGRR